MEWDAPGPSFVVPEYVRAIAQRRLGERLLGTADRETLDAVEWWVANFTSEP